MNDRIQIYYPQGHMELVLSQFFPCTMQDAKKVFPLINGYANDWEKEKLRQYLVNYIREKKSAMKEMAEDFKQGRKRPGRNYRQVQESYKRAIRNLQYLED